jgi:hypothetical protein
LRAKDWPPTRRARGNGKNANWTYDYFGQLAGHTAFGGTMFRYGYDNARQLT